MRVQHRRIWTVGLMGLWSLALAGCQPPSPPQGEAARVSRVVSGQTLEVIIPSQSNQVQRVRLIGVSTPAWQQEPWFSESKQFISDRLSPGTALLLEPDLQPSITYDDGTVVQLAYVWLDNQLLNEEMVAAGWALAEERSPNVKYRDRLSHAQEQARLLGVGLWNPDQPMRQTAAEFSR